MKLPVFKASQYISFYDAKDDVLQRKRTSFISRYATYCRMYGNNCIIDKKHRDGNIQQRDFRRPSGAGGLLRHLVPALQDDAPRAGTAQGHAGRQGTHHQGGRGQIRTDCRPIRDTGRAYLDSVPQWPNTLEAKRHDVEGRPARRNRPISMMAIS